ncbi:MAG: hypothetical protein ACRC80_08600 [Waterburya sp.]
MKRPKKQLNFFQELNLPKKGSNIMTMWMAGKSEYSKIEGFKEVSIDFETESHIFLCEEIKFIPFDKGYAALMKLSDLAGLYKSDEHDKDKDLFYLVFHAEKYEKYSAKDRKRLEVEPSAYEKFMCAFLSEGIGKPWVDDENVFSGSLSLHFNPEIINILPATPNLVFKLEELEEAKFLNKEVTVKAGGGRGYGGAKAQSEGDKLKERKAFIFEELALADCKNIAEGAAILADGGGIGETTKYLLELILNH